MSIDVFVPHHLGCTEYGLEVANGNSRGDAPRMVTENHLLDRWTTRSVQVGTPGGSFRRG